MLKEVQDMKVKISNEDYMEVKGRGTIALETSLGTKMILNVLFVLDVDKNLLSVHQLLERGFKLLFKDNMCLIRDVEGQQMFTTSMKSRHFPLDPRKNEQITHIVTDNVAKLWHKKLGHCNQIDLQDI